MNNDVDAKALEGMVDGLTSILTTFLIFFVFFVIVVSVLAFIEEEKVTKRDLTPQTVEDDENLYESEGQEEWGLEEEVPLKTIEEKVIHSILDSDASTEEMKTRAETLLPHFASPTAEEIALQNKQEDFELDLVTLERIVKGRLDLMPGNKESD